MKIAISSNDGKITTQFSSRFGRCNQFVIFDTEDKTWNTVLNPAVDSQGGAGTKVVQFLSQQHVDVTITGHYGPNAYKAINASNIDAYEAQNGTPQELVERYFTDQLDKAKPSNKTHKK